MPTNFDKIKGMNINEMAEVFETLMSGFVIAFNMMLKEKDVMMKLNDKQSFKKGLKQWLESEAN